MGTRWRKLLTLKVMDDSQYLRHELSVPMTVLVYYEVGTQWDNIRTSRKRKVRVIRYYMPENMPDSWGCQLPILCVHVIMCPVLTVRVSFSPSPCPCPRPFPSLSRCGSGRSQ